MKKFLVGFLCGLAVSAVTFLVIENLPDGVFFSIVESVPWLG